jgi:hypothetical protein
MTYIFLALVAVALFVFLAARARQGSLSDAILGFARSMDTTSVFGRRHDLDLVAAATAFQRHASGRAG